MKKWKPFLPGDTLKDAGVHVLQVLTIGRNQDATTYTVRCLNCREKIVMKHSTIRGRAYRGRRHCALCRENVRSRTTEDYGSSPTIPPSWPVPPMFANQQAKRNHDNRKRS